MSPFPTFVLSILMCVSLCSSTTRDAQPHVTSSGVVFEATNELTQFNGRTARLLVRLTDDGKVEWDKYVRRNVWEPQTSSISAERLSEIRRTLNSIDTSQLHGVMGPYHIYVDTSVELQIHMAARQGEVTFSVRNPWSPSVIPTRKLMPKEVRAVVCEIDGLHAQVAGDPVDQMCKESTSPR